MDAYIRGDITDHDMKSFPFNMFPADFLFLQKSYKSYARTNLMVIYIMNGDLHKIYRVKINTIIMLILILLMINNEHQDKSCKSESFL